MYEHWCKHDLTRSQAEPQATSELPILLIEAIVNTSGLTVQSQVHSAEDVGSKLSKQEREDSDSSIPLHHCTSSFEDVQTRVLKSLKELHADTPVQPPGHRSPHCKPNCKLGRLVAKRSLLLLRLGQRKRPSNAEDRGKAAEGKAAAHFELVGFWACQ